MCKFLYIFDGVILYVFLSSEIRNSETPLSFQLIVKTVNVFSILIVHAQYYLSILIRRKIFVEMFFAFLFAERTFFWSLLQQDLSDH